MHKPELNNFSRRRLLDVIDLHLALHFLWLSRVIQILNILPCRNFAENRTPRTVFHIPKNIKRKKLTSL